MGETDKPKLVLVVDDEEHIRLLLSRIICLIPGTACLLAPNVAHAFQLFCDHKPSLVITDLDMPGETGLDLLAKIRGSGSRVPVVLFSGSLIPGECEKAEALGVDCVITKPAPMHVLNAAIRKYLKIGAAEPARRPSGSDRGSAPRHESQQM